MHVKFLMMCHGCSHVIKAKLFLKILVILIRKFKICVCVFKYNFSIAGLKLLDRIKTVSV
jgi:hypothetical protein